MLSDKALIRSMKKGCPQATRELYQKYITDLLKISLMITSDVQLAEDCVHDVFVRFASSISRLNIRTNLKGYLICAVINEIRAKARRSKLLNLVSIEQVSDIACPDKDPQQWAVLNEQLKILSNAMSQLPQEQREALTLKIEAGWTFRKIAEVQNASISTVQSRYQYALQKLRSVLKEGE